MHVVQAVTFQLSQKKTKCIQPGLGAIPDVKHFVSACTRTDIPERLALHTAYA